jgi:hypothetical protein
MSDQRDGRGYAREDNPGLSGAGQKRYPGWALPQANPSITSWLIPGGPLSAGTDVLTLG